MGIVKLQLLLLLRGELKLLLLLLLRAELDLLLLLLLLLRVELKLLLLLLLRVELKLLLLRSKLLLLLGNVLLLLEALKVLVKSGLVELAAEGGAGVEVGRVEDWPPGCPSWPLIGKGLSLHCRRVLGFDLLLLRNHTIQKERIYNYLPFVDIVCCWLAGKCSTGSNHALQYKVCPLEDLMLNNVAHVREICFL